MLVVDFEKETEMYVSVTQAATEEEDALPPVSETERIEALEAAMLELAEVILNG